MEKRKEDCTAFREYSKKLSHGSDSGAMFKTVISSNSLDFRENTTVVVLRNQVSMRIYSRSGYQPCLFGYSTQGLCGSNHSQQFWCGDVQLRIAHMLSRQSKVPYFQFKKVGSTHVVRNYPCWQCWEY